MTFLENSTTSLLSNFMSAERLFWSSRLIAVEKSYLFAVLRGQTSSREDDSHMAKRNQ